MKQHVIFRALKAFCAAALLGCVMTGCHTPKNVIYFQDLDAGMVKEISEAAEIKVRPDDRLSIVVVSKNPELATLFNLPLLAQRVGQPGVTSAQRASNEVASYVVDAQGNIQFPVLGTVHIGGMRRSEVAEYIAGELISRNLMKDPTVIVDFVNRGVNVLGEVMKPGRVTFDRDRFTVLDAIAGAGDLTIQGKREDVLVVRIDDEGKQTSYRLDLTDADATVNSPGFYLQQNDVVYVSPNNVRIRQTTANGSAPLTPSFWISIASLATTVAVLIWK
ncbi:MAG: polysaccharide biosynthesis/export family protein [Muribaculaceae bacterium]|nr:polysaccharide biosynthesis/export family protein [Muribaculaceae bacterium]MDE6627906.1 polysaccharide biosynthesis/export family protein [Muribaculaceae bacterium]